MLPYCKALVAVISNTGDNAHLCRSYDEAKRNGIAFFLSCHGLASPATLQRNHLNLVIHASNLPEGRGWSPLTWQILEGKNRIPVCLLEASENADSGRIIYRDHIEFEGHELIDEMREALASTIQKLCLRFLEEDYPPEGKVQEGRPTYLEKRKPEDSRLDINKTIAEQINILRVVDNDRYPAWFEWQGHSYQLVVKKYHSKT